MQNPEKPYSKHIIDHDELSLESLYNQNGYIYARHQAPLCSRDTHTYL